MLADKRFIWLQWLQNNSLSLRTLHGPIEFVSDGTSANSWTNWGIPGDVLNVYNESYISIRHYLVRYKEMPKVDSEAEDIINWSS